MGHRSTPLLLVLLVATFVGCLRGVTAANAVKEVVVRIPANDDATKLAIVDAMAELGHGPDCPKDDRAYIEAKLPESALPRLQEHLTKASTEGDASIPTSFTIVEDPTRAEYQRFIEESALRRRAEPGRRFRRRIDKRQDPLTNFYNRYHSQEELTAFLRAIAAAYPNITRMYSIGETSRKTPLYAIEISDNPGQNEVGEVEFQYIANMHGDEVVGREMSVYFIYHLCSQYETNIRVKRLVDSTSIHILPTMNPDGFTRGARSNVNGVDINRDFPDQYSPRTWGNSVPLPPLGTGDGSFTLPEGNFQAETRAVMKWMGQHHFALAANFHGGSVVANYPFDGNRNRKSGVYTPSPDDDLYKELSRTYAAHNEPMAKSREFPGGITNGADWYVLYGGMQDYAYLWHGTMHITIELSDDKWPASSTLDSFWNNNRESMISYIEATSQRVWGVVTDCQTGQPITTGYVSLGNRVAVKLDSTNGDYHRLIPSLLSRTSASYSVTATAPGYTPQTKRFEVNERTVFPIRQDMCLRRSK